MLVDYFPILMFCLYTFQFLNFFMETLKVLYFESPRPKCKENARKYNAKRFQPIKKKFTNL